MTSVQQRFEDFPGGYARHGEGVWAAYRRLAFERLAPLLPEGRLRVLDVGGGSLVSLPALLDDPRVDDYVVVDLVDKLAPRPRLRVIRGDALDFCAAYDGPPFQAAVVFGVLMYLPPERASALVRRLAELLAPDAALLVHEPNARSAAHLDPALERTVDVPELARAAGLEVVSREDFNVPIVRGALARLGRTLGSAAVEAAAPAAVRFEALWGGGLDTLAVLRRRVPR